MFNSWQEITLFIFGILDQGIMIPFIFIRLYKTIKTKSAIKWKMELVQIIGRTFIFIWCFQLIKNDSHNFLMATIYMLSCLSCIFSSLFLIIYKLKKQRNDKSCKNVKKQ